MMEDFKPFHKLWENVNSFKLGSEQWVNGMCIKNLKAGEIVAKVDSWHADCYTLSRQLQEKSPEAVSILSHLRDDIEKFQLYVPLIKALSNEALKSNHWEELSEIAKLEEPLNPDQVTVKVLIDMGIQNYIEEIEDMSERAQREFRLEQKLS
jgi:dynein heavy chain